MLRIIDCYVLHRTSSKMIFLSKVTVLMVWIACSAKSIYISLLVLKLLILQVLVLVELVSEVVVLIVLLPKVFALELFLTEVFAPELVVLEVIISCLEMVLSVV